MPVCAVPHCNATLSERNTTGVCRPHMHRAPHCACSQCRKGVRKGFYRVATASEIAQMDNHTCQRARARREGAL
jgi:hypothetical protein